MESLKRVSEILTTEELLAQLAEECNELAQSALKMRRAMDGTNPTPKSFVECLSNLKEEYADVCLCMKEVAQSMPDQFAVNEKDWIYPPNPVTMRYKTNRWIRRLEEAENG